MARGLTEIEVLTLGEAASLLKVGIPLLEGEITAGRLRALRIGDETRILKEDFREFLEAARFQHSGPNNVDRRGGNSQRAGGLGVNL